MAIPTKRWRIWDVPTVSYICGQEEPRSVNIFICGKVETRNSRNRRWRGKACLDPRYEIEKGLKVGVKKPFDY